jgi:hypothetical protein
MKRVSNSLVHIAMQSMNTQLNTTNKPDGMPPRQLAHTHENNCKFTIHENVVVVRKLN